MKSDYSCFGIGVRSELPLPGLSPTFAHPDLFIHLESSATFEGPCDDRLQWRDFSKTQAILRVSRVGEFIITQGREIRIQPHSDTGESQLRHFLLGPVMGAVLYQRGNLVFRANVVASGNTASAFIGGAGSGKSTLSALLVRRGYRLVTDDVANVTITSTGAKIPLGCPYLNLSPESVKALNLSTKELEPLAGRDVYRVWNLCNRSAPPLFDLDYIFILAEGETERIQPIGFREAVVELVSQSYPTCFSIPGAQDHLMKCIQLASSSQVFRLQFPRDLSRLSRLSALFESNWLARVDESP